MDGKLIKELKVLRTKPGEILVIQANQHITTDQVERMQRELEKLGLRAVILDKTLSVTAVQAAA